MRTKNFRCWVFMVIWTSAIVLAFTQVPARPQAPQEFDQIALTIAVKRYNLKQETLMIVSKTTAIYQDSGKMAFAYKFHDPDSGRTYSVFLDPNGEEVNEKQLIEENLAAYRAKYGKMSPGLAERLKQAKENEWLRVGIALNDAPFPRPMGYTFSSDKPYDPALDEEFWARLAEYHKRVDEEYVAPFCERLKKIGVEVLEVYHGLAIVEARMQPKALRAINEWDEVFALGSSENKPTFPDKVRPLTEINPWDCWLDLLLGLATRHSSADLNRDGTVDQIDWGLAFASWWGVLRLDFPEAFNASRR
jgi:hypothetical protein